MNIRIWFVLAIALCLSSACATTPALMPTPQPNGLVPATPLALIFPPTLPAPIEQPPLPPLPKPLGDMADNYTPPGVPACKGAQSLDKTIRFSWEQWDSAEWKHVITHAWLTQWTYYRCPQPLDAVSDFYRQWMISPAYNWSENHVEQHPDGTLLVYNNSTVSTVAGYRWVYLWLLPEKSDDQVSDLVAVWFDAPYNC
jgi:hypothetical protein